MFYSNTAMTNLSLPHNAPANTVFEVYEGGKAKHSFCSEDTVTRSKEIYDQYFSDNDKLNPVFMPCDLETPLGFACFLGNNLNGRKIFVPSNYNMTRIFRSLET